MAVSKRKKSRNTQPKPGRKKSPSFTTRSKKAVARLTKKTAGRVPTDKSTATAAAPLLARAPKKIGTLGAKTMDAVNPCTPGSFAAGEGNTRYAATAVYDSLALARPWMRLCVSMVVANFALQARVAQAAMDLPRAALRRR